MTFGKKGSGVGFDLKDYFFPVFDYKVADSIIQFEGN